MAEPPPRFRLTDAELDEAFGYTGDSLRLTAALSELRDVRPVVAAARAWLESDGSLGALIDALTDLRAKERANV